MTKADYQNMYFSILGDSVSTLAGYNPPENAVFYDWENKRLAGIYAVEDTWWGSVIDALGGKLLRNESWSGSLVCKHPNCEIASYGCSDARTVSLGVGNIAPDVVMILMGLNDFGWAMRPRPAAGEQGDLAVFSVAYRTMLERIRCHYPQAEIWCLTLPVSTNRRDPSFEPPMIRGGWHLLDYCGVIRTCANEMGCRLLDICRLDQPYDTIDGYHPTADGMKTIANAVLEELGRAVDNI